MLKETQYDPDNYFLKHNYDDWFENKESTDTTRESDKEKSDVSSLEDDEEEVKEGKELNIFNLK